MGESLPFRQSIPEYEIFPKRYSQGYAQSLGSQELTGDRGEGTGERKMGSLANSVREKWSKEGENWQ